jgi:hypothetical protein
VECSELVAFLDHVRYASTAAVDRWEVCIERDADTSSNSAGVSRRMGHGKDSSGKSTLSDSTNHRSTSLKETGESSFSSSLSKSNLGVRNRSATTSAVGSSSYAGKVNPGTGNKSTEAAAKKPKPKDTKRMVFNNYFGIGVDASIAHSFHQARNQEPHRYIYIYQWPDHETL